MCGLCGKAIYLAEESGLERSGMLYDGALWESRTADEAAARVIAGYPSLQSKIW